MCAISGSIGLDVQEAALKQMLSTMRRRGPDGSGVYRAPGCALLHTRLAIIDPTGGSQPQTCRWENETYTIVYNGELYNTQELRRALQKLGHRFRTTSDTEVVLHAYAQWKEESLEKMNGIFAFAVWEENSRRLFLARDRCGVKPLFYLRRGQGLLFASEIKTILAFPGVKARLDAQGAAELVMLGPGRIPGSGVFRDIRELEPGEYAWFQDGRLSVCRYWRLLDREHTDTFPETVEKLSLIHI